MCFVTGARTTLGGINQGDFDGVGADRIFDGAAAGGFSQSMARNLCMLPLRRNRQCQDYMDIQFARAADFASGDAWGTGFSARHAWLSEDAMDYANFAICSLEDFSDSTRPNHERCLDQEIFIFNDLIGDISRHAQEVAIRNQNAAKNACIARNRGVQGLQPNFLWSLVPEEIPSDYAIMGLTRDDGIEETERLWGAFCAVRVTMLADDPLINDYFGGRTMRGEFIDDNDRRTPFEFTLRQAEITRYFSQGDSVICGSWITQAQLNNIDTLIRSQTRLTRSEQTWAMRNPWLSGVVAGVGGAVAGGAGGAMLGNLIGNQANRATPTANPACTACVNARGAGYSFTSPCATDHNNFVGRDIPAGEDRDGNPQTRRVVEADLQVALAMCRAELDREAATAQQTATAARRGLLDMSAGAGRTGAIIGATAGGLGTAWLVAQTTESNRLALEEAKKDAAVQEWFSTVGNRIHCIVNGRRAGSYGDVIELR